jgi:hypothetical protein
MMKPSTKENFACLNRQFAGMTKKFNQTWPIIRKTKFRYLAKYINNIKTNTRSAPSLPLLSDLIAKLKERLRKDEMQADKISRNIVHTT